MTQQEYNDKVAQVASLAVAYVKTDRGYYQMRETIPSLSKEANKWLEDQLKDIANDYTPARSRGFRR